MTRRDLNRLIALGWLGAPAAAGAQDLGQFFEQAARDVVRRQLDPERIEQTLKPRQDGELHPVRTADGWTLTARRYPPAAPQPGRPPVILCHGLTYSAAFWDLHPSVACARWLSQRGWDVWAVDLRGCSQSQKWVFRLETTPDVLIGGALRRATKGKLGPSGYASVDPRYANWTLDDHVAYDLPAFIRLVQQKTGSPQVYWVGHSMGGIVPLCHLSRYQNPAITRLVTVGSQLTMRNGQLVLPLLEQMILARQRQLVERLAPEQLAAMTQESVQNLFFNVRHVSREVYEALGTDRTDIPAIGLMKQYTVLSTEGELWDARKQFNYARSAANIRVPVLIDVRALDQFAPPPVQKDLYDRVGSTDKTALVFGRARGFAADSGHDDALVGLTSMQQVYPVIERWLLTGQIA